MPQQIPIHIDAGAAMGFITNTATIGRMKHIDLRKEWVQTLRNKEELEFKRVLGTENTADFFTKIQPASEVQKALNTMMKKL